MRTPLLAAYFAAPALSPTDAVRWMLPAPEG